MNRPMLIGLTGSIGMGKSTTAEMFAAHGLPVWDADAAVHRLYGPGGAAVAPLGAICPDAVKDGVIDRKVLKSWIARDAGALEKIEQIVHPLVAADRVAFINDQTAPVIVLDIPLLFETGADAWIDLVAVVSTDPDEQRRRVMARPGMTKQMFEGILAKQTPDAQKRARADVVIDTTTMESAARDVDALVARLKEENSDA